MAACKLRAKSSRQITRARQGEQRKKWARTARMPVCGCCGGCEVGREVGKKGESVLRVLFAKVNPDF
jgi:hypothetical protein